MKNNIKFITIISFLGIIYGCPNLAKEELILIEKGVTYNTHLNAFQFESDSHLSNYLYKVKELFDQNKTEEGLEQQYISFENQYKHKSLRKIIADKEKLSFANDTWTEEDDPDNFFIQDEILRLILNENVELIVGDQVITFIDNCELIQTNKKDITRLNSLRKARNDIYDSFNIESFNILNYCDVDTIKSKPSEINIEKEDRSVLGRDCCDKNDRNTLKYYDYTTDRKMKAVLWQMNVWLYHGVGVRTTNYKKKSNGKWDKDKADVISVDYGGTLYFKDANGSNCSREEKFGIFDKYKTNENEVSDSYPLGGVFWTKKGSLLSNHFVKDNGKIGRVSLCLTSDCGGCTETTGFTFPKHFWTTDVNGESLPKSEYMRVFKKVCHAKTA